MKTILKISFGVAALVMASSSLASVNIFEAPEISTTFYVSPGSHYKQFTITGITVSGNNIVGMTWYSASPIGAPIPSGPAVNNGIYLISGTGIWPQSVTVSYTVSIGSTSVQSSSVTLMLDANGNVTNTVPMTLSYAPGQVALCEFKLDQTGASSPPLMTIDCG